MLRIRGLPRARVAHDGGAQNDERTAHVHSYGLGELTA